MKIRSLVLAIACLASALCPSLLHAQHAPANDSAAILGTIEEEKNAFVDLDANRLAAVWARGATSVKLYVFDGAETRFDGFAAIETHDLQNLARERALPPDQRSRFSFIDHHVVQQGDSAWVTFHATWTGYSAGTTISEKQTRVYVLQWTDGRWKIALMAIVGLAPDAPPSVPIPSAVQLNAAD